MNEPSYERHRPQEMTRADLVRAITEWQQNDDTRLDLIVDLLDAAKQRLESVTYQDGVDLTRCAFCLRPVKQT